MSIPLEKYGETFLQYTRRIKSAYLKPFRTEIKAARAEAEAEILKSSLGKRLWGGTSNLTNPGAGTPRFLIGAPRLRFSKSETLFVGGFKILGMAALMVKGGRTESHLIKPKRGRFMRFSERAGGDDVFAQVVRHPGGAVKRVDVIQRILEKRAARFAPEAARALDEAARESFK